MTQPTTPPEPVAAPETQAVVPGGGTAAPAAGFSAAPTADWDARVGEPPNGSKVVRRSRRWLAA
jgi:hypothetical protein